MSFINYREKRAEIFRDTQQLYTESDLLRAAVEKSRDETRIYPEDDYPIINRRSCRRGIVTVSKARTFEAAIKLHNDHVCRGKTGADIKRSNSRLLYLQLET